MTCLSKGWEEMLVELISIRAYAAWHRIFHMTKLSPNELPSQSAPGYIWDYPPCVMRLFFQSVNSMDWLLEHAVVILVLFLNSWQFSLWPTEGSQMSEVFLSHWVSLRYTRSVDNSQEWVGMKDRARPWIYTNLPTERVQIFWWGQNGRWTHVAQGSFYFFLRWN